MSFFDELKRRNVLRVAVAYLVLAWLLVQVGSILLPTFHAPEWVMQVLVLLLAAGFLVAIFFSWVYELTPEGLKRESEVDRSQSITHHTARKLDIGVIVLLVAVAGVTVLVQRKTPPQAPSPQAAVPAIDTPAPKIAAKDAPSSAVDARPSVAVLPFVNMSSVAENEYFADGLSETLLNMLAQVSGLKVAARTSAFAFKGSKTDIREIARTLNVHTVLEGSVQRAGERVRITAQLIDAKDGSHLWSQSYDRELDDIFAIQDEIASAVAAELTRSLMGAPSKVPAIASLETHDTAAYDLYLRGLEQRNLDSYGSLPIAERLFKQALEKDPGFTEARISLAQTYYQMSNTGLISNVEAAQRGRPFLAPLLDEAGPHAVARSYDAVLRWRASNPADFASNQTRARDAVNLALKDSPNSISLYELGAILFGSNDRAAEQALDLLERGLQIDPLSTSLLLAKARSLRTLNRYDEALGAYARVRELLPDSPTAYSGTAWLYFRRGQYSDAVKWIAQAARVDKDDHELPAQVATLLMGMRLADEALPWITQAESRNAAGAATRKALIAHAVLKGETERALELTREVIRQRAPDRAGLYPFSLLSYFVLMRETGREQEAARFIQEIVPGVLGPSPPTPTTENELIIEFTVIEFLSGTRPPGELAARAARLEEGVRILFPDVPLGEGFNGVLLAAMQGETAKASGLLEKLIADRKDMPTLWRIEFRSPLVVPLLRDPGVAGALAALEADIAQQVVRYRTMVAAGEIAPP